MNAEDVGLLRCLRCRGSLRFDAPRRRARLTNGQLVCIDCGATSVVRDGLPHLYDDAGVRGVDRLMRCLYDTLARLHDPAVALLLPVLQGSSATPLRNAYLRRLELAELRPLGGQRLRILEVGAGSGANLPLLERDLPRDLEVELWGVDLSLGMIEEYRRRLNGHRGRPPRLLLADAHNLPFPDASFDRVFHVGGIAGYHNPRVALAEMARVARPSTPIVVVDEQLDPRRAHGLYYWAAYQLLTFYNPGTGCPRAELPADAVAIVEEQISRFYYCLTFRMPVRRQRQRRRQARRAP